VHHQEVAQTEADLKQLLHRRQDSPDIVADELTPTALHYSSRELLNFVRTQNPEIRMSGSSVVKQNADLKSVEREGKPDFSIGFMCERTGLDFPAYYMLTFGVSLPRRARVRAEASEASESLAAAKERFDAVLQQQLSETQKQYATAASAAELLAEYRDGLIPQADAVFRAGIAGYESNQQSIASVLVSFNDGLEVKRGYYQSLLDHEIAITHLEELTGKELR
jgi:cobalt-zinc-cadmium efflux system outer membrane protein